MEDTTTILAHISSLKEMLDQVFLFSSIDLSDGKTWPLLSFSHLDRKVSNYLRSIQVNEEIEANIQVTREIESSIVKCEEIEIDLENKEAELIKTSGMLQFENVGFVTVAADLRASVSSLEKELGSLKMKRNEIVNGMDEKREMFTKLCLDFQRDIDKRENCEASTLLSEKHSLENEIQLLDKKNDVLKNSVLAFVEEILEDLHSSNSALEVEIQRRNWENEKLLKDINDLKNTLLSAIGTKVFRYGYGKLYGGTEFAIKEISRQRVVVLMSGE
ncbi:hypothetical protein Ahy_A03g015984 [Arachis hypogaea]|uniref:Uncharacterized protein n=1 Tax=Arachis hypogaea TaxID=3818 RepID=A0A445E1R6_ARAHY|nr:hypothetical protein Ahy_A03g015984 [Arachis hypogaea]